MKTKIFLAILAIMLFATSMASAASSKAEIYLDTSYSRHQYYLVDPMTREELTLGYDYITTDEKGNFVGHSGGSKETLNPYTGEPVRRFYHEEYKQGNLFIGELGACKYILDPATKKRMSSGYHEVLYRDGLLLGQLGAMTYILNPKTKRRASKGYHEIYTNEDGQLIGERGASKEVISLTK